MSFPTIPKAVLNMQTDRLTIDGEPFPWYISTDGVEVGEIRADPDSTPIATLTLTFFVEEVEVIPANPDQHKK